MHNDILTIGKFTIHGYSLMIVIGIFVSLGLCLYRAKKDNKDADTIYDYVLISVIGGMVGAKLLYLLVAIKDVIARPKDYLWYPGIFSGFVVYGGIIMAIIVMIIYSKIKKTDFFNNLDYLVPHISIVQGFGRIGCFLAGCCYGAPTDSFIGVVFPKGSIAPAGVKLWPTQLISAVGNFAIAGILLFITYYVKKRKKGLIGLLYVMLYSIGRFGVEYLRNDARGEIGPFSTSQFIAIITFAISLIAFSFLQIKGKDTDGADKSE